MTRGVLQPDASLTFDIKMIEIEGENWMNYSGSEWSRIFYGWIILDQNDLGWIILDQNDPESYFGWLLYIFQSPFYIILIQIWSILSLDQTSESFWIRSRSEWVGWNISDPFWSRIKFFYHMGICIIIPNLTKMY